MSTSNAAEARRERGRAIADLFRIVKKGNRWLVPSQSGRTKHSVCLDAARPYCSCPDFEAHGEPCKHVYAAQIVAERDGRPEAGGSSPEPPKAAEMDVRVIRRRTCAPRPTYRQVWPAYNSAQTREKAHFQALMADLCRGVPEPERKPGPGRKPASMADLAFAMAFKVFGTFSGRRSQTDLDEAHAKGYLSRPMRYNTVLDAFDNPALTPILRALITESSLPLRSVETCFAPDSSGFGTSRFARWYDEKYGTIRVECEWVKCHLMCGVWTNIVTAVDIDGTTAADNTRFEPLLDATARNHTVREVAADAAYLTYAGVEAIARLGATPFIAIKSNTTGEKGGPFRDMFHYYSLRRDDFLAHYHKRSNVESTFSMIKAKFGDSLRSKCRTAMINEALCKILAHNVCCLIQSAYELGIAVVFWGEDAVEPDPEPDALPIEAFAWI